MTVNLSLGKNWKTTLGGAILSVAGFVYALPTLMPNTVHLSPKAQGYLQLAAAIGGAILGFAAKDSTTHSTLTEVQTSTNQVASAEGVPAPQVQAQPPVVVPPPPAGKTP